MSILRNTVLLSLLMPLAASPQSPASKRHGGSRRRKAYTAQNWTEAEAQYSALAQQSPTNARFWYRLGVSARHNKDFDVALKAMEKAKRLVARTACPYLLQTTRSPIPTLRWETLTARSHR